MTNNTTDVVVDSGRTNPFANPKNSLVIICVLAALLGLAVIYLLFNQEKVAGIKPATTTPITSQGGSDTKTPPAQIVLTQSGGKYAFEASSPFAEEGKVYSDSEGNTFERHTVGQRMCYYMANGVIIKRVFVGDPNKPHDVLGTKVMCDVIGKRVLAEMKETTKNGLPGSQR